MSLETGTTQTATVQSMQLVNPFSRLRERLRIQQITEQDDPDYPKRTRQLLEQLDEYPTQTGCLIVSFADLAGLLAIAAPPPEGYSR